MRISTFEHGTNNLAMQLATSIVAHILELDYIARVSVKGNTYVNKAVEVRVFLTTHSHSQI